MQFDSAVEALIELAVSRHNAFSTSEAAEINFSARRLKDASARGEIRRLHPKVWAMSALPSSEFQTLRAATLALNGSAASMQSAAWLHGWIEKPPPQHQVWVGPKSRARQAGMRVHRFARIDPAKDLTTVANIKVLNKAATLCLVGAVSERAIIERCLDEFLRTESQAWLEQTLDRLYTPKAAGPSALNRVINDPLRVPGVAESVMERITAQLLNLPGLPPIVLQQQLEIDDRRFRLDLAWPELKLGVEFHSRKFHWGHGKAEADANRDLMINSLGWKLLYVTNQQVQNPKSLIRLVKRTAEAQAQQLGVKIHA